jgi:hypothetical protein
MASDDLPGVVSMGKPFKGVINVDIRDSVPDWVGPAIGLTQLPTVSRQAVYDVLRALTDAGLVRRIQPSGSVGGGTLERYNGAKFQNLERGAQKWKQGNNQVGQMAL